MVLENGTFCKHLQLFEAFWEEMCTGNDFKLSEGTFEKDFPKFIYSKLPICSFFKM